jgi:hypothetical protein
MKGYDIKLAKVLRGLHSQIITKISRKGSGQGFGQRVRGQNYLVPMLLYFYIYQMRTYIK